MVQNYFWNIFRVKFGIIFVCSVFALFGNLNATKFSSKHWMLIIKNAVYQNGKFDPPMCFVLELALKWSWDYDELAASNVTTIVTTAQQGWEEDRMSRKKFKILYWWSPGQFHQPIGAFGALLVQGNWAKANLHKLEHKLCSKI